MKDDIHQILKKYWGYTSFRPLQEDIILSVLEGHDTLALLPTGGGKSICFQVPVMAREGIGIIISPLIALMADQVNHLKNIDIPAIALTSGLTFREMDLALDRCVHGKYKFLYISPERLQNEMVQERIKRMKVNLLVVDEAHCISQWGYDFRPPYQQIAEIRPVLPNVPILALTATATSVVVDDIQEKLDFRQKKVLQKSFYRSNLYYNVTHTEKKWSRTLEIIRKLKGTGIIYVRNRRNAHEIAKWLQQNQVSADYYHAGLSQEERRQKQEAWINNKLRVMVCTNAFGMGIDKPDVRFVLHLELPDSLEAYFQEAGRGGRDGKTAYSVVLVGPGDIENIRTRYLETFPDIKFIRRVYNALVNYLQIPLSSPGAEYPFDLNEFKQNYQLPALKTYQALSIMEKEGLLDLKERFRQPSRILITVNRNTLYDFQLRNPKLDPFIKLLFRSYGGLDLEYVPIQEAVLAQRLQSNIDQVRKMLFHLKKQGILDYLPQHDKSMLTLTSERIKAEYISISDENLRDRFEDRKKRIEAVIDFISNDEICRSRQLLAYFGENQKDDCGYCDVCRKKERYQNLDSKMQTAIKILRQELQNNTDLKREELREKTGLPEIIFLNSLRWLLDNDEIPESSPLLAS